ncbi:MAG: 30S ribosomal protein S6 [Candidatus Omnitrophica bacterium]|nr:30S ribosomal protein S6 [Candidatus Omnitrophota bacterium]
MQRKYESMVIVRSDISDQEQEEIFGKITKKIESLQGKVLNARVWIKERSFCFYLTSSAAGKKKYDKGCYWLITFNLDTEKLPDLKETMRLEERMLRHLILRQDEEVEEVAQAK